jgi:hypothetical protein
MAKKVTHNQESRETAIKLALAGDKSIAEVARELGLPEWNPVRLSLMQTVYPAIHLFSLATTKAKV